MKLTKHLAQDGDASSFPHMHPHGFILRVPNNLPSLRSARTLLLVLGGRVVDGQLGAGIRHARAPVVVIPWVALAFCQTFRRIGGQFAAVTASVVVVPGIHVSGCVLV